MSSAAGLRVAAMTPCWRYHGRVPCSRCGLGSRLQLAAVQLVHAPVPGAVADRPARLRSPPRPGGAVLEFDALFVLERGRWPAPGVGALLNLTVQSGLRFANASVLRGAVLGESLLQLGLGPRPVAAPSAVRLAPASGIRAGLRLLRCPSGQVCVQAGLVSALHGAALRRGRRSSPQGLPVL